MGWRMQHDPAEHDPDLRYELVILAGPAAGTYHGSTATMAATAAQDALDDHKVGWTT